MVDACGDAAAAPAAVWDAFLGDLRTAGWVIAGAGAVIAAAATSLIRPIGIEEPLRAALAMARHRAAARRTPPPRGSPLAGARS